MFWHTQKKDIKTILPVHMYLQKLQYQIMNQVCGCVCVCVFVLTYRHVLICSPIWSLTIVVVIVGHRV